MVLVLMEHTDTQQKIDFNQLPQGLYNYMTGTTLILVRIL